MLDPPTPVDEIRGADHAEDVLAAVRDLQGGGSAPTVMTLTQN